MFIWIIPVIFIVAVITIVRKFNRSNRRQREYNTFEIDRYAEVPERIPGKRPQEGELFKIAQKYKGRITISDIVLETGMSIKEAEALVEPLVDGLHIRMEVSDKGFVIYEFPEIIARFDQDPEL